MFYLYYSASFLSLSSHNCRFGGGYNFILKAHAPPEDKSIAALRAVLEPIKVAVKAHIPNAHLLEEVNGELEFQVDAPDGEER